MIGRYAESPRPSLNSSTLRKFTIYENRDISGADLKRMEKVDQQACETACGSDGSCQAFSYDKWNKWCFLKSGLRPLSLEPSSLVGVRSTLPEPEMSKEALRIDRRISKTFVGKPYQAEKRQSLDVCEANCLSDQKCVAYSFVKDNLLCKSYDQVETFGPDATTTSGIKTQNPP